MISVITPVYNGQKYIENCLINVISQECPDLEHIIIDGCSTDKTVHILQQYTKNYPHIRYLSQKDKGQSDAMNTGVEMARGDIIGVLNVDDFYEPNVINLILKIFKTLPEPSILVGNCNVLDEGDNLKYINAPKNLYWKDILLKKSPHPFNPSAYFYHKCLHSRIGVYDLDNHNTMDLDFLLKALRSANVKYIDEILGNYRSIEGTKTSISRLDGSFKKYSRNTRVKFISNLPIHLKIQVAIEAAHLLLSRKIKILTNVK